MRRCDVFIRPSLSLSACFGVGSPRIRWRLWLAAPNELTLIHVPVLGFDFKASQRTRAWTGLGHMLQLQLRQGFFSPPAKGKSENNCEELWEKEISVHSPRPPLHSTPKGRDNIDIMMAKMGKWNMPRQSDNKKERKEKTKVQLRALSSAKWRERGERGGEGQGILS